MLPRALGKRVIVIQEDQEEKVGSLYVPDISESQILNGKVVSVGSEVKEVQVGDRVKYIKSGIEFRVEEGYFLTSIRMDDIVAIL